MSSDLDTILKRVEENRNYLKEYIAKNREAYKILHAVLIDRFETRGDIINDAVVTERSFIKHMYYFTTRGLINIESDFKNHPAKYKPTSEGEDFGKYLADFAKF